MPGIHCRRADSRYWVAWFADDPATFFRGRTHFEAIGRLIFHGTKRRLFKTDCRNEDDVRLLPYALPENARPDAIGGDVVPFPTGAEAR